MNALLIRIRSDRIWLIHLHQKSQSRSMCPFILGHADLLKGWCPKTPPLQKSVIEKNRIDSKPMKWFEPSDRIMNRANKLRIERTYRKDRTSDRSISLSDKSVDRSDCRMIEFLEATQTSENVSKVRFHYPVASGVVSTYLTDSYSTLQVSWASSCLNAVFLWSRGRAISFARDGRITLC